MIIVIQVKLSDYYKEANNLLVAMCVLSISVCLFTILGYYAIIREYRIYSILVYLLIIVCNISLFYFRLFVYTLFSISFGYMYLFYYTATGLSDDIRNINDAYTLISGYGILMFFSGFIQVIYDLLRLL